ncbi:hypothetical protein [Sandarakinorhabdus sp.]|nr:hypothetical protein [Sandarakinorhabdus sp.]
MQEWLAKAGTAAVLVRPDRHVFGAGAAADLLTAWQRAVSPAPAP